MKTPGQSLSSVPAILALVLASCTTSFSVPDEGIEGGACFPNGTCDVGLECNAENICQVPAACQGVECGANGWCQVVEGAAECECDAGYRPEGLSCVPVDYCSGNPCQNGGVCRNDVGGYTCDCPSGYTGTICETVVTEGAVLPVSSTMGDDSFTKAEIIAANGALAWRTLGRAVWGDPARENANPAEAVDAGEIVEIQDSAIYEYSASGIGGGSYPFAVFATVNSGTPQDPIVVRGAAGEFPTLQVQPQTGDAAVIGRDGDFGNNYVRYENLKARDVATVTNVGEDVFRNEFGLFRPQGGTGIVAERVELEGQTRDYNGVVGVNYAAIRWDNSTDCEFSNGKIHGFHTLQVRAIACDTYGASGLRMFQNTIWDMDEGMLIKESGGSTSEDNWFYRNLVFDVIKACFSSSRSDGDLPSYVFQNVFIGGSGVIKIDGSAAFGNVVFANNTVIDPSGDQGVFDIYNWVSAQYGNHWTQIRNNICTASAGESMMNLPRDTELDGVTPAPMTPLNLDMDMNLYFRADGQSPRWDFRGAQYSSLAEWRLAITNGSGCPTADEGRDCGSQVANPQFVSYMSSADFVAEADPGNVVGYKLQSGSPAEGAGVNVVGHIADVYGIALGQPITLGAYIDGTEQIGADW